MVGITQKRFGPGTQSLKRRLLALLGFVLFVSLLVIATSVLYFVNRTEQAAWQGRQSEAARNAGQTVSAFVQRVEDTLAMFSALDHAYVESNPMVTQALLAQNEALFEIVRLDKKGNIFAAANRGTPTLQNLFTIPQSNWFISAAAGNRFISNIQVGSNDELYMILSAPAADGVVAARLRMDVLWGVVEGIRFGESGSVYLIDDNGQILAHTDHDIVLSSTSIAKRPELQSVLGAPDHIWSGSYINVTGDNVVSATAPVTGTHWIVITELTQNEAFAVSRTALILLVGGMILFGFAVQLITSQLLTGLIFTPVQKLQTGVEYIAQGDLDYRIDISRRDEIGQVGDAFNEMAGKLRDREAELATKNAALADQVAERERLIDELQDANQKATEASRLKSEFLSTINTGQSRSISRRISADIADLPVSLRIRFRAGLARADGQ